MANRTDTRPNLLLFMPDQLRADAVSGFALPGSAVAHTPVLDARADRAARLEVASGRYAAKSGLQRDRPALVGRAASVRTDRWTYIHLVEEGPGLYDRLADPFETVNLAGLAAYADGEEQLRHRLLRWSLDTAVVLPEPDEPWFADIAHGSRTEAVTA